nr:hypothetical protein BgiMline_009116 [Biomphalaria glabrata]
MTARPWTKAGNEYWEGGSGRKKGRQLSVELSYSAMSNMTCTKHSFLTAAPNTPSKQLHQTLLPNSCTKHSFQTAAPNTPSKQLHQTLLPNSCTKHSFQTAAPNTPSKQLHQTLLPNSCTKHSFQTVVY